MTDKLMRITYAGLYLYIISEIKSHFDFVVILMEMGFQDIHTGVHINKNRTFIIFEDIY